MCKSIHLCNLSTCHLHRRCVALGYTLLKATGSAGYIRKKCIHRP